MTTADFMTQGLPGRAVLRLAGPDVMPFLQGLLTADVGHLAAGGACYGALLTPQGKMLFDLFVYVTEDAVLVDCAESQAEALLKRLSLYRLRARVSLARDETLTVAVASAEPAAALRYRDPRSADLGWRFFAARGTLAPGTGYDAARIAAGLADSDADLGSGEFFPHEANLDQFGGVSFSKGCYVGQEVVARMEHRATARSRIVPVRLGGAAPPRGSDIRAGEVALGTLLGACGDRALALIRLDRLGDTRAPLLTEGVSVTVLQPPFARYAVPGVKD